MPAKSPRRRALSDHKRAGILDAARRVIARNGLDRATMRAIAKEADYTPGALYAHYPSKDHLLVELAGKALALAARNVRAGAARAGSDGALAQFSAYFRGKPEDLDLLLTVLQSSRSQVITGDLERTFTGQLIAALAPISSALVDEGLSADDANAEALDSAALALGLLMLGNSGRLTALGVDRGR